MSRYSDDPYEKMMMKALGITKAHLKVLRVLFGSDGFVRSVEITKKTDLAQSKISEAAKKLIEYGWIESSSHGYRRIMSVEDIKADMIARYRNKAEAIV